jgi:uncharacterized protein YjbI with pentapeptide repeats
MKIWHSIISKVETIIDSALLDNRKRRVRFEVVTPGQECVASFHTSIESLSMHLDVPIYQGYDAVDVMTLMFVTLPSGKTVTLRQYEHLWQARVDLYVHLNTPDMAAIIFESCQQLQIARSHVAWLHPNFEKKINALYVEHSDIEQRPKIVKYLDGRGPIDCFKHALQIYNKLEFPEDWARLQHHLGLKYVDGIEWNSIDSLLSSIYCYQESLTIFSQADFPRKWKEIQSDLNKSQKLLKVEIARQHLEVMKRKSSDSKLITNNMDGQDLRYADLRNAKFQACSSFEFTDLSGANLSGVKITRCLFNHAKLAAADLSGAILSGVYLRCADLSGANLNGAQLGSVNLNGANLSGADLNHLDLRSVELLGVNFSDANVENTRFGSNEGISLALKRDLMSRGAIFDES